MFGASHERYVQSPCLELNNHRCDLDDWPTLFVQTHQSLILDNQQTLCFEAFDNPVTPEPVVDLTYMGPLRTGFRIEKRDKKIAYFQKVF